MSNHFAKGEFVRMAHRPGPGEIISVAHCKCRLSETVIRVRWADGTEENLWPYALNRKPLGH